MTHIHEDRLLEYALDTVEDGETRNGIESHIEECEECRAALARIRRDIEIIGGIAPDLAVAREIPTSASDMPESQVSGQRRGRLIPVARAAALILFGIAVGLGGASWFSEEPATVVPQYFQAGATHDTLYGYAVSDATAMPDRPFTPTDR